MPLERPPPQLVVALSSPEVEEAPISSSRRSSSSSAAAASTASVEPLHGPERRRSSGISFEKHGSVVMAELFALLDDDDDDSVSTEDDDNNEDEDEDASLDGIPTAEEAPEVEEEGTSSFHRSIDIDEIAAAFNRSRSGGGQGSFGNSRRQQRSSRDDILGRIEDEIIEKGIRDGKLTVAAPEAAVPAQQNEEDSSLGNSASSLRGASFSRASFSSFSSFGRHRRNVSFSRPPSTASLTSLNGGEGGSSAASSRRGSSRRQSSSRSRPSLGNAGAGILTNIRAALRELASEEEEEEESYDEGNDNRNEQQAPSVITVVEADAAAGNDPPSRGAARPRRSSLKRPDQRRDWS